MDAAGGYHVQHRHQICPVPASTGLMSLDEKSRNLKKFHLTSDVPSSIGHMTTNVPTPIGHSTSNVPSTTGHTMGNEKSHGQHSI